MKLLWSTLVVLFTLTLAAPTLAQHRRAELDHVGAYNFTVEIEGINAGYKFVGSGNGNVTFTDKDDGTVEAKISGKLDANTHAVIDKWLALQTKDGHSNVTVRMIFWDQKGYAAYEVELTEAMLERVALGHAPDSVGQLVFYASTTNPIDPKKVTRLALENAGSIAN